LSKAHVTRDSSGPATLAIRLAMHSAIARKNGYAPVKRMLG